MKRIELVRGERFGRLRYIRDSKIHRRDRQCIFKCDCGVVISIGLNDVRQGKTKSCGCLKSEVTANRNSRHRLTKSHPVLYSRWRDMHRRCYSRKCKSYRNYGGRGIRVAKIWHGDEGLQRFIEWSKANGFSVELEIDRKDNTRNYAPNNCRWIERVVNLNNRRNTLMITHPVTKQRIAFAQYFHETARNVRYDTASWRVKQGWDLRSVFKHSTL